MKYRRAMAALLLRYLVLGFTIAGGAGKEMRPPMLQRPGVLLGPSPRTTSITATSSSSSSSSVLSPSSSSSSYIPSAPDPLSPASFVEAPERLQPHSRAQEEEDDYLYEDYEEGDGEYEDEQEEEVKVKVREPFFGTANSTTTTVFLGATATLDCTVHDIANESVTWMRRVDDMLELLTWDTHTYAKDKRYSVASDSGVGWRRWRLLINGSQVEDQGQYRCQVATQPPKILAVTLVVTEPLVQVVDERGTKVVDKHYNSGSMIELKCVIEKVPFPHLTVNWLRGSTVLSFNTSRGGISVKGDAASGFIRSRLYVADASPADSGLYSCWYGNYTSDTVSVHVIAGENSAAMQHDALPDGATASGAPSLHCPDHLYQLLIPVLSSWSLPNVIAAFTTWLLSSQSFWVNKIIGATR
ncbi:hemicentin-2 [Penaeus vannamei]|uniref:hemicentin-2 n=1 Tax=Penaeus vannamei TaxID=6689 RepID=UPI00387F447A